MGKGGRGGRERTDEGEKEGGRREATSSCSSSSPRWCSAEPRRPGCVVVGGGGKRTRVGGVVQRRCCLAPAGQSRQAVHYRFQGRGGPSMAFLVGGTSQKTREFEAWLRSSTMCKQGPRAFGVVPRGTAELVSPDGSVRACTRISSAQVLPGRQKEAWEVPGSQWALCPQ